MSAERPILFSAPMVRALLAGTKTQTRRVVKLLGAEVIEERPDGLDGAVFSQPWPWSPQYDGWVPCPYGVPGDRLWVKETFAPCTARIRAGHFHYRADGAVGHRVSTNGGESWWSQTGHTLGLSAKDLQGVWVGPPKRWKPSIFMTRAASRITLEVTAVRVERLHAITEGDAMAEGVDLKSEAWPDTPGAIPLSLKPTFAFELLWKSINGDDSWAANPWVWVVEFKRVTP